MNEEFGEKGWSSGAPEKLYETIKSLENALTPVRVVDSALNRLYYSTPDGGFEVNALAIATGNLEAAGVDALKKRGRFNLLKSAIDSYCAMVVQVPAIDVTTTGGSEEQQRSAEALGLFIDGVFAACGMHGIAWSCVIDSCLSRVGAVRVDWVDGRPVVARLLPHQVTWNPNEGTDPRNIFTRTPVSRAALMAEFEGELDKLEAIKTATTYRPDPLWEGMDGCLAERVVDMVEVQEGWRRANTDGTDGKYVRLIMTPSGPVALNDDGFTLPRHVVVPLRFSPSYSSYAGTPAGDTLIHYQNELDDFADTIKEAFVKGAVMRVIVDRTAEVDERELEATQGRVLYKNPGTTVQFDRGTTLPPEYLQREQVIIERAFSFLGVSYNSARGAKADGVSSAKGQREVAALAQNRLVLNMQTIQNWIVDIGKTIIAVTDARYSEKGDKGKGKDIEIKVPGSRLLRRVKWSEIGYRQQDFEIHCDAINALSRHPAARIEEVLELVQGKILDEREGLKAIGVKDLMAVRDKAFSREEFADKIISLALRGDFRAPDPFVGQEGLTLIVEKGKERYVQELVQDEPSEYLNDLRRLIKAAETELERISGPPPGAAPEPVAPPPPAMGASEMAVPGAGLPTDIAAPPMPVPGQGIA